jgi:hypothetical protein
VAYRLFRDGKHLQRIRPGREHVLITTGIKDEYGKPVWVEAGRVSDFIDEDFYAAFEIYAMCELLATLPFGPAWAENPADIIQTIAVFKAEDRVMQSEKLEKNDR